MFFLKIINVPEKIRKRKAREANPARICLVPLRENRNREVWHFAAGRDQGIVRAGCILADWSLPSYSLCGRLCRDAVPNKDIEKR